LVQNLNLNTFYKENITEDYVGKKENDALYTNLNFYILQRCPVWKHLDLLEIHEYGVFANNSNKNTSKIALSECRIILSVSLPIYVP